MQPSDIGKKQQQEELAVPTIFTFRCLDKTREILQDHENNNIEEPVVVLENVELAQYDDFMEKYEDHLRPSFVFERIYGGKVVVQELPSKVHECCSHTLSAFIQDQINAVAGVGFASHTLNLMTSPKYALGNIRKEPDLAIECEESGLLTLVVEVAWKNESLQTLRDELEMWKLHRDVRIVIGIKLFVSKKMKLIKLTRHVNADIWSNMELDFGENITYPPDLDLDIADLYYGSPIPHAFA
jgi:hypothetical protein